MILSSGQMRPIALQAYAEIAPQFYNSYFVPRTGLDLETRFATYAELYRIQPWVSTVVNKIANLIARLGIQVWDESSATGRILDSSSPYARLLANPCPTMNPYSFWQWLSATVEVFGEAYLIKGRDEAGRVISLIPMHPSQTKIRRLQDGSVSYQFLGMPNHEFGESDIVPFRSFDPFGSMRGMSRLEPLRSTLMNEDSARRATSAWWRNMGRPSMMLTSEKRLGPEGRQRLQAAFRSATAGSGNAGGVVVLEDDIKPTVVQLSAEEMQYIESRKLNREEVCAVFDVPPTAVHILDHATYSNITEQFRSVYRDTMAPRIVFLESVLNFYIGADFDVKRVARFAVAEVLRGDFEKRAEAMATLVQSGIAKPSEARPFFDLDDAGPVADKLYANSAIQELGTVKAQPAPVPVADEPPIKYLRDMRGLLGRGKSTSDAEAVLLAKHPDDRAEILRARELIERQS